MLNGREIERQRGKPLSLSLSLFISLSFCLPNSPFIPPSSQNSHPEMIMCTLRCLLHLPAAFPSTTLSQPPTLIAPLDIPLASFPTAALPPPLQLPVPPLFLLSAPRPRPQRFPRCGRRLATRSSTSPPPPPGERLLRCRGRNLIRRRIRCSAF